MMANRRPLLATCVALFFCLPLSAQDEESPSDDFLEYLATLVEEDGGWVDPLELDELPGDDFDSKAAHETLSEDTQHAEEQP